MPSIQNGKNISIHFTEDEIHLLHEFEQYREQNNINRSSWVEQYMKKVLTDNKKQFAFRWNKNLNIKALTGEMFVELSEKKSKRHIKSYLD